MVLLTQYLLDNVLTPLSEAKFQLRSQRIQPTIANLIV